MMVLKCKLMLYVVVCVAIGSSRLVLWLVMLRGDLATHVDGGERLPVNMTIF